MFRCFATSFAISLSHNKFYLFTDMTDVLYLAISGALVRKKSSAIRVLATKLIWNSIYLSAHFIVGFRDLWVISKHNYRHLKNRIQS